MNDRVRLHELWARVEGELRAALSLTRKDLSPATVRLVEEFLDHNELGLAFDLIVEEFLERDLTPLPPVYDHLERAASEMELSNGELWSRFANRFGKLT